MLEKRRGSNFVLFRSIVGIELLKNSSSRLLIFDPSNGGLSRFLTSPSEPPSGLLRALRKAPGAVKSRQYQVVAVTGLFSSKEERSSSKVVKSARIP